MSKAPLEVSVEDTASLRAVSKSLYRFTLASVLSMGLVFVLISSAVIKSTLSDLYQKFADKEIAGLEASLNQILQAKLSTLSDHASLPIVVNAVMHPEEDTSSLIDQLENLRILENNVDMMLLDINGDVIESTKGLRKLGWSRSDWVEGVVENDVSHYVAVVNEGSGVFVHMAVPVMYNNYPEGVLVAVMPFIPGDVFNSLEGDEGRVITVSSYGKDVYSIGIPRTGPNYDKTVDLPIINGTLNLVVHKTIINEGMNKLLALAVGAGILTCLVLFSLFRKLGQVLVIKPQMLLERSRLETLDVNKRLEAANEELAQFAYRASHDMKAPLISARVLATVVGSDIRDGEYEEAIANTYKIASQVERLETLVTDILDLAKADLAESDKEHINLCQILADIDVHLEHLYVDHEVEIIVDTPEDISVFASRPRLSQVLVNLISNGVKYSNSDRERRYVRVSAVQSAETTQIIVKDNGLGVPEQFQGQLFDMFTRFHPQVSSGSGLGLYIIKKHIDNMNASISFESTSAGSVFRFTLPSN